MSNTFKAVLSLNHSWLSKASPTALLTHTCKMDLRGWSWQHCWYSRRQRKQFKLCSSRETLSGKRWDLQRMKQYTAFKNLVDMERSPKNLLCYTQLSSAIVVTVDATGWFIRTRSALASKRWQGSKVKLKYCSGTEWTVSALQGWGCGSRGRLSTIRVGHIFLCLSVSIC